MLNLMTSPLYSLKNVIDTISTGDTISPNDALAFLDAIETAVNIVCQVDVDIFPYRLML